MTDWRIYASAQENRDGIELTPAINELNENIRYKPGSRVSVELAYNGAVNLELELVIDVVVRETGNPLRHKHRVTLGPVGHFARAPDLMIPAIAEEIEAFEIHESREWLRIGELPVQDPHP